MNQLDRHIRNTVLLSMSVVIALIGMLDLIFSFSVKIRDITKGQPRFNEMLNFWHQFVFGSENLFESRPFKS